MLKRYIYILLLLSLLLPYENSWVTTRFERWWNEQFNSMVYREPFSFIPYKITIGKFYYGGNDFWSSVDLTHTFGIGSSPFQTINGEEFNYINNIKYREGVDLEISFLGYNFLKNIQSSVDVISGFSYKFSRPLTRAPIPDWFDNGEEYHYYPILGNFKFNITFMIQQFKKFSPYLNYSYGLVRASLFRNLDGDRRIKASGTSKSLEVGFNIVNQLKNKNYNLLYGFEVGLNEIEIDEVNNISSKLTGINTKDIALRFTIGVAYGGNRTIGDDGFDYLINSDYIDAIDSFNRFKIKYPKHPKVRLANRMIEFSRDEIAYDMFYNGVDSYMSNDINSAIDWYRQALAEAVDLDLIYEIESRQYIIANELYANIDTKLKGLSIEESLEYIQYIESISPKIIKTLKSKKLNFLYKQADIHLKTSNYRSAFDIYLENKKLYPEDTYMYTGRVNGLVELIIEQTNKALTNQDYIMAYENMKLLNTIYPDMVDYLENNINMLKEQLEMQNLSRISKTMRQLSSKFKNQYQPTNQNVVISIGDKFEKIKEFLGEPIEINDRIRHNSYYTMLLYEIGGINYRLFFENNILFDLEEIK